MAEHIAPTDALWGELARLGVSPLRQADLAGMSVLSVTYPLVVWCARGRFVWRDGPRFTEDLTFHPADDPAGAAARIHHRWLEILVYTAGSEHLPEEAKE